MIRRLTVLIGLAMSMMVARSASAIPITPVDLDTWVPGSIVGSHANLFDVASPPATIGAISSNVFVDGNQYTYVHTVTPHVTLQSNSHFATAFSVANGFTGVAGWSFSDAGSAGGTGTNTDFLLTEDQGRLTWSLRFTSTGPDRRSGWDPFEPIAFFFVSSQPPGARVYDLLTPDIGLGTAQTLGPIPEPGSFVLLGSGLAGLYASVRRRRSPKR
jgi:PEP-CTERM motif